MNFFVKLALTFPLFMFFSLSNSLKIRKIKKKKKIISEESLYKWTKRWSRYLLWLQGSKFKIRNSESWDEKASVFFIKVKYNANTLPLFLAKKNNFSKESPFFFAFDDKKIVSSSLLKSFYSVLDPLYFDNSYTFDPNKIIEKIKTPRTLFFFYKNSQSENLDKVLSLAINAYAKIVFTSLRPDKKFKILTFKKEFSSSKAINLSPKFLKNEISKES